MLVKGGTCIFDGFIAQPGIGNCNVSSVHATETYLSIHIKYDTSYLHYFIQIDQIQIQIQKAFIR